MMQLTRSERPGGVGMAHNEESTMNSMQHNILTAAQRARESVAPAIMLTNWAATSCSTILVPDDIHSANLLSPAQHRARAAHRNRDNISRHAWGKG